MRNILLLIALSALFCFANSLNLQSFAKSFDSTGLPFINASDTSDCSSLYDCLGDGDDSCDPACNLTAGNCCAFGLTCYGNVSTNATCVSNNIGDWCSDSNICFSNYVSVPGAPFPVFYTLATSLYSCVDNECVLKYFPGDYCEASTDCVTGNCDTDNNVCVGLGFNATCTQGQCAYGLTCSIEDNRCARLAAPGEKCAYDAACYPGYACIAGNCTDAFSAQEGDKCSSDLSCDTDYVCNDGTCVSGSDWESSSCDTDSDCDSGSVCLCSQITGEQFCSPPASYSNYTNDREALSNVYECVRENNCTNFGMAPNSCIMQNCESDADDTYSTDCDVSDDAAGDCYYNDSCGGFPVWAIIVIVIVAVVLVLVIVVVVVMAMRKRRQYDTIA